MYCKLIMADLSEFHAGQRYQFLINHYPIPYKHCRKIEIRKFVKKLSREEVEKKCTELLQDKLPVYSHKDGEEPTIKTYRYYKFSLHLYQGNRENDFYQGRCYQLLQDSSKEIIKDTDDVVEMAEELWQNILERPYRREGREYYIKCCDNCSTWFYGRHRCECGGRRMMLSRGCFRCKLDDVDTCIYPEAY